MPSKATAIFRPNSNNPWIAGSAVALSAAYSDRRLSRAAYPTLEDLHSYPPVNLSKAYNFPRFRIDAKPDAQHLYDDDVRGAAVLPVSAVFRTAAWAHTGI